MTTTTTAKPKLSTVKLTHVAAKALTWICGHEQDLDAAILVQFEDNVAQALRSLRSSIAARESGRTPIGFN